MFTERVTNKSRSNFIHKSQEERDKEREIILEGLGCKILRFTNEEVENIPFLKKRFWGLLSLCACFFDMEELRYVIFTFY